jgi:hypothetical protein
VHKSNTRAGGLTHALVHKSDTRTVGLTHAFPHMLQSGAADVVPQPRCGAAGAGGRDPHAGGVQFAGGAGSALGAEFFHR